MTDATAPPDRAGASEPEDRIGLEEAFRLYRFTTTPVAEIARRLERTVRSFHKLRRRLGWPLRRPDISEGIRASRARPKRAPALPAPVLSAPASVETPAMPDALGPVPTDPRAVARMLRDLIAQEIARLRARQASSSGAGSDATLRTLALLARSHKTLSDTIEAEETADASEAPGRSLAELRDELYRRLVRLRAERKAARRDRELQSG